MRQTDKVALINGRVHTPLGIVKSIAFEAGRITKIGALDTDSQSGEAHPPQDVRVIDLHGMTVLPGFCDSGGSIARWMSARDDAQSAAADSGDDGFSDLLRVYAPKVAALGITEVWSDDMAAFGHDFRRMWSFFTDAAGWLPFRLRAQLSFRDTASLDDFLSDGWRTGDGVPFCQVGAVICGVTPEEQGIAEAAHMAGMQLGIVGGEDTDASSIVERLEGLRKTNSRHIVTSDGGRRWENVTPRGGRVVSAGSGKEGAASPMTGIAGAVAGGMSVAEAISLYTWNAAWNGRNERRRGELLPGCDADMVVLDKEPFSSVPAEMPDTGVVMTVCGGCVTYDSGRLGEPEGKSME